MPARRRPVTESCDVLGRLRRGRWTGWAGVKLASSPMTAMNCRSLKSARPVPDIVWSDMGWNEWWVVTGLRGGWMAA